MKKIELAMSELLRGCKGNEMLGSVAITVEPGKDRVTLGLHYEEAVASDPTRILPNLQTAIHVLNEVPTLHAIANQLVELIVEEDDDTVKQVIARHTSTSLRVTLETYAGKTGTFVTHLVTMRETASKDEQVQQRLREADQEFSLFSLYSASTPQSEDPPLPSHYLAWLLSAATIEQQQARTEAENQHPYTLGYEAYESEHAIAMHYQRANRYLTLASNLALLGIVPIDTRTSQDVLT